MKRLLRLLPCAGLCVCAVPATAATLFRSHEGLLGPARLLLFAVAVAVYFLPAALAWYRDSKATLWIALVNILLGWTVLGWFAALGWAAGGATRPAIPPQPHPVH